MSSSPLADSFGLKVISFPSEADQPFWALKVPSTEAMATVPRSVATAYPGMKVPTAASREEPGP